MRPLRALCHAPLKKSRRRPCDADAKQVENKVVLVRRRDAFNPFHGHETILAVWSTYIALGLDPCDTGLLLTDHFDDKPNRIGGPILELLRRVFAPVYGVEKAIDVSSHPNPTCYKKLYIAIDFIDNLSTLLYCNHCIIF